MKSRKKWWIHKTTSSYLEYSSWKKPCIPRRTTRRSDTRRRSHGTRRRSACQISRLQPNRRSSRLPLLPPISSPSACYIRWWNCKKQRRLCESDNLTFEILACRSPVISLPTGTLLLKMSPQLRFSQLENCIRKLTMMMGDNGNISHHPLQLILWSSSGELVAQIITKYTENHIYIKSSVSRSIHPLCCESPNSNIPILQKYRI